MLAATDLDAMARNAPQFDESKGELRILGRRYTAVDAQALCEVLDSLVGPVVAEVMMKNVESRIGKEDALNLRRENPNLTKQEILQQLIDSDRLGGAGLTEVTIMDKPPGHVSVKISNPSVMSMSGAAKVFLSAWWAGALSGLFGTEYDIKEVVYDKEKNTLISRIEPRPVR